MLQRHMAAAVARHRGPRPVGRQLDLIRQVLQAPRSRTTAAAPARCRRRSHRPAPPAATACSRRIAPAAATVPSSNRCPSQPRPVQRRQVPRQRTERPAVAGDVVQHDQQHVLLIRCTARTDAPAAGSRSPDRSPARPRPSAPPQARLHRPQPISSRGRADSGGRISCRGTPSRSGNKVRRLSCRSTRSPSAASSATRSSVPLSRTASGIT